MKNKKSSTKPSYTNSILGSTFSENAVQSSKLSLRLLSYYKDKSEKLEKGFEDLSKLINKVKSVCDYSNEIQGELNNRNEEVSKLQKIIGDLQIHLFKEREQNLKLSAENDQLRIEDYTNKKKINLLLMSDGASEKKFMHLMTNTFKEKIVPSKLPPKLQKLKEEKRKSLNSKSDSNSKESFESDNNINPQVLILKNQLLASQLEYHIRISREQIEALLKEKEISDEEKQIERQRLQKSVEMTSQKLKESQELLCKTVSKLINYKLAFEKEESVWFEEKTKYLESINILKEKLGDDVSDVLESVFSSTGTYKNREKEDSKTVNLQKEQMAALYQDQILALEAEINRLREKAQICRNIFREKTEKMTAQVTYLRNKYEDLDKRRQFEAEGFRTDIRMLRERLKECEKKLIKNSEAEHSIDHQELLITARHTLNHAKQLEKELTNIKSKIMNLESDKRSE